MSSEDELVNVLAELVQTEEQYITFLDVIVQSYIVPLQEAVKTGAVPTNHKDSSEILSWLPTPITNLVDFSNSGTIKRKDVAEMFPCIQVMLRLHQRDILPTLQLALSLMSASPRDAESSSLMRQRSMSLFKRTRSTEEECSPQTRVASPRKISLPTTTQTCASVDSVASLFMNQSSLFKLYSRYVTSLDKAWRLIGEMRGKAVFQKIQEEAEMSRECKGQTLESLMIMPVQRLPRYSLIVDKLLQLTQRGTRTHGRLQAASSRLSDVLTHINESKRQSEGKQLLSAACQRIEDEYQYPKIKQLIIPTSVLVAAATFETDAADKTVELFLVACPPLLVVAEHTKLLMMTLHSVQTFPPHHISVATDESDDTKFTLLFADSSIDDALNYVRRASQTETTSRRLSFREMGDKGLNLRMPTHEATHEWRDMLLTAGCRFHGVHSPPPVARGIHKKLSVVMSSHDDDEGDDEMENFRLNHLSSKEGSAGGEHFDSTATRTQRIGSATRTESMKVRLQQALSRKRDAEAKLREYETTIVNQSAPLSPTDESFGLRPPPPPPMPIQDSCSP